MPSPSRRAAIAAYSAAALNLAAALALLFWLRPGLPVEGSSAAERSFYLESHRGAWWAGWLLWHAAAIALLALYVALADLWRSAAPLLCGLAPLLAAAGLAADLSAEALYMGLAPGLAASSLALLETTAGVLTGYLGNGLYSLTGMLLTIAGARELPRPLVVVGAFVWAAGFALSAATLLHSPRAQCWSTAVLMPLFVVWSALVGRWLNRNAS